MKVKVKFTLEQAMVGWDSAVGIATRYGLDGPGIEYRPNTEGQSPQLGVHATHNRAPQIILSRTGVYTRPTTGRF
jgi:hypothetical protein